MSLLRDVADLLDIADGIAALGVAAAVSAQWVRVNVLTGAYVTDQGLIAGEAAFAGFDRG